MRALLTADDTVNAMIHDGRLDSDMQLLSELYRQDSLARPVRHWLAAPSIPPAAASGGQPGEEEERRWPEGGTVLVVEDDPLIRMNLVQMVEILGLHPAEAGRADKALAWLQANPAPVAMLTDLSLPGMDGISLAVEARKIHPRLPVLLVTGHNEASVKVPPELRPGPGFLGKPFAMPQLEKALQALWRQSLAQ